MKCAIDDKTCYYQQPTAEDNGKELFRRIHCVIMEQQLFLDPMFSRQTYMKLGLINKNKVAQLIHKYTGTNLNGYINSLRLDYAVKLMLAYPEAPMKAIAADSGFSNIRTFYRLFLSKYGMSPSEYTFIFITHHAGVSARCGQIIRIGVSD